MVYIASANPASRTELRFSSALMGNILSLCLRMARATEDNTAALRELSSQVQSLSLKVVALQSQLAEMSKGHESRYVILGKMTLDDEGRRHLEIAITTSTDCRQDLQTLVSAMAKNSVPASMGSRGSGKAVTPSPSPGKDCFHLGGRQYRGGAGGAVSCPVSCPAGWQLLQEASGTVQGGHILHRREAGIFNYRQSQAYQQAFNPVHASQSAFTCA